MYVSLVHLPDGMLLL